jgi:MFS family permease
MAQADRNDTAEAPWYAGVGRYEWTVLAVACAGWIFDVYEGQIFNITRNQMLADILGSEGADVRKYGDMFLGVFLLGGTVGGLAAGSLADRFGRRPIMIATILMYSFFSGLTYFATELWHVAGLRFLVAMGVGGEWAVAASLVAEVFPIRARAQAAVGLGTFWAVTVAGQDLARQFLLHEGAGGEDAAHRATFAYGIVQTAGGGIGLLAFGPLCARFGRRRTFIGVQVLAFLFVPLTCFVPQSYRELVWLLPLFGFLTLGMHAGYAIYFPELFPTHLRATGTSFCFNGGRVLAVPVLFFSGWLKSQEGMDLRVAVSSLSLLFLLGAFLMLFLPETKGQDLPD